LTVTSIFIREADHNVRFIILSCRRLKMKKYISILLILIVLTMSVAAESILPATEQYHKPKVKDSYGNSLNWGGYAVLGTTGSVTDVNGSWIVPAVTCSATNSYSAFWIGIDGDASPTVEQTGTSSDCNNGVPTYYAWYEFYPQPAYYALRNVKAGDNISAEVKYSGRQFTIKITDVTTGASFSRSSKVNSAQRNSAEWIAEAPWNGGVLPLANFNVADYGFDYTKIGSTNTATVNTITRNIGSFNTNSIDKITMVTSSGATKSYPSAISNDGTSFNMTWVSP
jgi:hypothetical protein